MCLQEYTSVPKGVSSFTPCVSYILSFDVSTVADGPLELSLIFHPGGEDDTDVLPRQQQQARAAGVAESITCAGCDFVEQQHVSEQGFRVRV